MDTQLQQLQERIQGLEGKAQTLLETIEASSGADRDEAIRDLKSLQEQVKPLLAERDERLREEELRDMKAQVKTLSETIEEFRSFNPDAGRQRGGSSNDNDPYATGDASFFQDISLVSRGGRGAAKAMERLSNSKAMTEGTDSDGGYLVAPQVSDELLELRVAKAPLLGLIPHVQVNSDTLQFIQQTGGLTAGWVAELAEKPDADMTFGSLSVSVFTAAGLAVVSNQLLADAGKQSTGPNVGIDSLIVRDLGKRLATLQEVAILDGSGTGQPRGILQQTGTNGITVSTNTQVAVLDAIVDAAAAVHQNLKDVPTHVIMHPRTWAWLMKAKESSSPTTYIVGPPAGIGRRPSDGLPGPSIPGAVIPNALFGMDVVLTANMPTNKGAGADESRIIVGRLDEALILDRQGVTVDTSEHVYFTSNQTVFRAELRTGFTAARYPEAFSVISGTGLKAV